MAAEAAAAQRPIEEACYWLANRPARAASAALGSESRVDVAIVGGGFTGLWTAFRLLEREPGLEVALLEQSLCGYGASGRNAGIVGETLDHGHALAVAHFGRAEASRMARLGRENLEEIERTLARHGIDAGFVRPGQLIMALQPQHVAELAAAVELAHQLGSTDWRLLSAPEARAEIASPLYLGALLVPGAALVHPLRLIDGLRRAAVLLGLRLHEQIRVREIEVRREDVLLRCPGGTVRADRVVLATNAYSHLLWPRLRRWFLPLYDYVLVSDPLTPAELAALGWRHRRGVTDARAFFNYSRMTDDDRVLWGTSEAVYHGGRVGPACDHSATHYRGLEASFGRHFPQLDRLAFPYAWGGPIASTTRFTPFFGAAAGGRVLYGLGYTGHGIASSHLAGRILAALALDLDSPLLDLAMVRRRPVPFPPEPLRGWAIAAVTHALRRADAGGRPGLLLRALERLGIGLSS
ncbi:MAG: NAD(P)/FAD-dependent oxidoreductase [Thermoanaerobaculia bacterium]